MDFHDVNLPNFIAVYAAGCSEFSTSRAITMSGREARSSDITAPKRKFTLKNCRLSTAQFEEFNNFFIARAGKRYSFRLKDHFDFTVIKQKINPIDTARKKFQLYKEYKDDYCPHIRPITKPKLNTIELWNNSNKITADSIEELNDYIILKHPLGNDRELIASFEFDVSVRFANDNYSYNFNSNGTISLENVEMVEVCE